MKESILAVLLYLFEYYFSENADLVRDRDSLQNSLIQVGFSPAEINKAFEWLDALAANRPTLTNPRVNGPVRVLHGPELDKLDVESRGFLLFLEQQGILNTEQRELVLDRAMALDQEELDLDDMSGSCPWCYSTNPELRLPTPGWKHRCSATNRNSCTE